MKIYGYTGKGKTKRFDIGFEDLHSIAIAGRKSSIGKLPTKSGEYKNSIRRVEQKKALRRYYKKALRSSVKLVTFNSY